MRACWVLWVLLVSLVLPLAHPAPEANVAPGPSPPVYAGWAVEAYPELAFAEMENMLRRQVQAGANVVWIGHNNPGDVEAGKLEPGLSYAVYHAARDPVDPRHATAVAIIEAQHRMLAACRTVGVKAVLPVGYQIQMGEAWNEEHPADLRRDSRGQPLDIYGGGVSATFYAPSYRQAIEEYYRWIDAEFVRPYDDVILMLNLADEPVGGDYSDHANAEFRRQYGFGFDEVGDDPDRQRKMGEFQSRYVVEYASYSAEQWLAIHPELPVTMSFDGGQARSTFTMPDVEALFREPPPNLVVTFDAYPHDGLPQMPMSEKDLTELSLLAQSLGLYSARHDRPLWLWAAANSWGLSQASQDPGTISDAMVNGLALALLVRRTGGTLQGIAYWNYNVKEQGLYNDTHATAYQPDDMFAQVSALLPELRRLMLTSPGSPAVLVLVPPAIALRQIGAAQEAVRLEVQPYHRLEVVAKQGVSAAVVSELTGWELDGVQAIVVLAASAQDLSAGDAAVLRTFLEQGGKVVSSPDVGQTLAATSEARADWTSQGLVARRGNLFVAQEGVAILFEEERAESLSSFWEQVLGIERSQPGLQIVTVSAVLWYNPASSPIRLEGWIHFSAYGYRYDDQGRRVQPLDRFSRGLTLGRREFILLQRPVQRRDGTSEGQ